MAQRQESIFRPSLPQQDSVFEQLEREAQLFTAREIYDYGTDTGLPMPMAASKAAIVQLPGLVDWVEGQGINQAKIFADVEAWKLETYGQDNFTSLDDYAKVFTFFQTPEIVSTWQDDKIFGSQVPHPISRTRPPGFNWSRSAAFCRNRGGMKKSQSNSGMIRATRSYLRVIAPRSRSTHSFDAVLSLLQSRLRLGVPKGINVTASPPAVFTRALF